MNEQLSDIQLKMAFKGNKSFNPVQGESQQWNIWISSPVDKTCEVCAENNGKIRPSDYQWSIEAPVHKNCRCEIRPLETILAGTGTISGSMGADWYLLMTGLLPDNYITEEKARSLGWSDKKNNLDKVAPGKAIGGDIYDNTNEKLPAATGRIWYKANINSNTAAGENHYILYSNDGLVFVSYDGFESFYEVVSEIKENPATGEEDFSAVIINGWTGLNEYLRQLAVGDYKITYLNDSDSGSDKKNLLLEYDNKKYILAYEYKNGTIAVEYDKIKAIISDEGSGDTLWIPSSILEYDGSPDASAYFRKYERNFTKLGWDQEKINALWQATIDINNQYSIQIDPRLLLAIIIQEGTGSFNTSSTNLAADGQHGVETNYAVDLMKANSLIFGKILGYVYYGDDFRQAVSNNNDKSGINGDGNVFQYCNWSTPIIDTNRAVVRTGPYAGHGAWGDSVMKHYIALGGDVSGYESYLSSIDKSAVEKIANELGINLPSFSFIAAQNAQDSKGNPNGNWTIKVK